tara:strand:+ start:2178 stop:3278 length:1101 start_codon:yes stop_codon:yes gene_type:complete
MANITNVLNKLQLIAPTSNHEDWLYYDIENLLSSEFENNETNKSNLKHEGFVLHFVNGTLVHHYLPASIKLKETTITPNNTNNSFIHLAIKHSTNYEIECASEVIEPIHMIFENSENNLQSTALEINLKNKAKLHIKRHFIAPSSSCLISYLNNKIDHESELSITDINNNNPGRVLDFIDAELGNESTFNSLNQSYLSEQSRFQNRVFINGEFSVANLHGLAINQKEQACFYNTHIYHDAENSESNQLFKSMVKANATLEYNGKVTVCKKAQKTNSYQLNQNILLDDYAHVYSRPQLFIDADDVKCTHGSTTGDINEHEVLYLMSRGLDQLTSRKIVLNAFFEEVFNNDIFKREQLDIHQILNEIL